jgi:hypothetical protein
LTIFLLWIMSDKAVERPGALACKQVPDGAEQEPGSGTCSIFTM